MDMRLIRDDAPEKLNHALTLLRLAQTTRSDLMRDQHLGGVERIMELCISSMKTIGFEAPKEDA
jgi:hypothetical protein